MPIARIKDNIFQGGKLLHRGEQRAFIGISLHNRTMESVDLLRQIFDWASQNVGDFDILVGDYLSRFNYQAFDNDSEAAACAKAMHEGDEARKRLAPLTASSGPYEGAALISAGALCARPSFEKRRAFFERQYWENVEFRTLIHEGVDAFLRRKHPLAVLDERIRQCCVSYQLEELVMFEQLSGDGYGIFIYPGAQLPVMKGLVSGVLDNVSKEIERLVLIELRVFGSSGS